MDIGLTKNFGQVGKIFRAVFLQPQLNVLKKLSGGGHYMLKGLKIYRISIISELNKEFPAI